MEDWQALEKMICRTAEYKWERQFSKQRIAGVNCDCAADIRPGYKVVIEISKENKLDKVRGDITRISLMRMSAFSEKVFVEPYIVLGFEPTDSMVAAGKDAGVTVWSMDRFRRELFDYQSYNHIRRERQFGSAIDLNTGAPIGNEYTPVKYFKKGNRELNSTEIKEKLQRAGRIILLGEFGSGKSRLFQELFYNFSAESGQNGLTCICINLRDCWGLRRAEEIIRRHFDLLGMSSHANNFLKIYSDRNVVYMLDGFDEISTQAWSDNPQKLQQVRKDTLAGVRDLLSQAKGGVIISGREHFFNGLEEMYEALGLKQTNTEILHCQDEFTEIEANTFLKQLGISAIVPAWLPRRPLILQTLAGFEADAISLLINKDQKGDVELFYHYVDAVCHRESLIKAGLDGETTKNILKVLARNTRTKPGNIGPISVNEINDAFAKIRGTQPVDESAIILQRLPGLGQVNAETSDRSFRDPYLLDGLRALDAIDAVERHDDAAYAHPWKHPLEEMGLRILGTHIIDANNTKGFLQYSRRSSDMKNSVMASDIIASLLISESEDIDCSGMLIENTHISKLDFSDLLASKLTILNSIIDTLILPTKPTTSLLIDDCLIRKLEGASGPAGIPSWIQKTEVAEFQDYHTVASIRKLKLNPGQRILITVLKKTFMQPGRGREEDALLRGLGQIGDPQIPGRIINLLIREDMLEKFKGDSGWVYKPNRSQTARANAIVQQLGQSQDTIWLEATKEE